MGMFIKGDAWDIGCDVLQLDMWQVWHLLFGFTLPNQYVKIIQHQYASPGLVFAGQAIHYNVRHDVYNPNVFL